MASSPARWQAILPCTRKPHAAYFHMPQISSQALTRRDSHRTRPAKDKARERERERNRERERERETERERERGREKERKREKQREGEQRSAALCRAGPSREERVSEREGSTSPSSQPKWPWTFRESPFCMAPTGGTTRLHYIPLGCKPVHNEWQVQQTQNPMDG